MSKPRCDTCGEYEEDCDCEEFDGWTYWEIMERRRDYEDENDLN